MSETFDHETGEILQPINMPKEVAAAIVAVKAKVRAIGYDEKNPHGGYPYVSVDKFYALIGPLMAAEKLFLWVDEESSEVKEGARGNPWLFVRYAMRFAHGSGAVSSPVHRSLAQPISGPQSYGAAQSYIEKQFLRQVFKVPTGEKDADEVAQGEPAPAQRPPARASEARGAPKAPLGVVDGGKGPSPTSAPQTRPDPKEERAELMSRLKSLRETIAEATDVELEAIEESQDLAELAVDFTRVLGAQQGGIQMKQLEARIAKRRSEVLPGYEL